MSCNNKRDVTKKNIIKKQLQRIILTYFLYFCKTDNRNKTI
ncbi:unknown [Bacteroides sp. CAG:714]|nr:unknown [Bacteroides sp. CAG:714]